VVGGGEVRTAVAGSSSAGGEALRLGRWYSGPERVDGSVATASPVSSPAIEAVAVNATVANSTSAADSRTQTMPPYPSCHLSNRILKHVGSHRTAVADVGNG
jgi:hypothetical protein